MANKPSALEWAGGDDAAPSRRRADRRSGGPTRREGHANAPATEEWFACRVGCDCGTDAFRGRGGAVTRSVRVVRRLVVLGLRDSEKHRNGNDHRGDREAELENRVTLPLHHNPDERDAQQHDDDAEQLRLELVDRGDTEPGRERQVGVDKKLVETERDDDQDAPEQECVCQLDEQDDELVQARLGQVRSQTTFQAVSKTRSVP